MEALKVPGGPARKQHRDFNPVWVLIFPFADQVKDKRADELRLRVDLVHRLKAAKLRVLSVVNANHTAVHVMVTADLERLEQEAEKSGFFKRVRCDGGLARYSQKKRHLFGHRVLDEDFFSEAERQELVHRIMISNNNFLGAGLNFDILEGRFAASLLEACSVPRLRSLVENVKGRDAEVLLSHKATKEDYIREIQSSLMPGRRFLRSAPLHREVVQEKLAAAMCSLQLKFSSSFACGVNDSILDVLHKAQGDTRAVLEAIESISIEDAIRDYFGEGFALYFLSIKALVIDAIPLVVLSLVFFSIRNSSSSFGLEAALTGLLCMIWMQRFACMWKRETSHKQHVWGRSEAVEELNAISLRSAIATDEEDEKTCMLTAENFQSRITTRRIRAAMQLLVLGSMALVCIGIYLLVRFSRAWIFGEQTSAWQVVSIACIDVARIYVLEVVGFYILEYLETWDDDMINESDRQAWKVAKIFVFALMNTFSSVFISVVYQAFATGTNWKFVEPPVCFDVYCQKDIELHIWIIVSIKYMAVPILIHIYHWIQFFVLKMKIAKKRELYLERKHPSKGLAEATKKRKSRRKTFFGLMDRITLRGDWDGLWGESPLDAQLLLRVYNQEMWEQTTQRDFAILMSFLALCTTLAPLLPFVIMCFWLIKGRLEALELIVLTRRAPVHRGKCVAYWNEVLNWIALLSILSTSICIMFVTADVEQFIQNLATNYRKFLEISPEFRNSQELTCVAGICLNSQQYKAQGALYWIIWICIIAIGVGSRILHEILFRVPSHWLQCRVELEKRVQNYLGLSGNVYKNDEEAQQVFEEFKLRYSKIAVDLNKFELPPQ